MVDLDILREMGSTQERLREVFTAERPRNYHELSIEEKRRIDADVDRRKWWQDRIAARLEAGASLALSAHHLYGAVDLAWNAPPIAQESYPLMLYAQGRLDQGSCISALKNLECADKFVRRDAKGELRLDLPMFCEVHVNLIRHIIERRLAAQTGRYNNLWPFLKYDSRSTHVTDQLRADVCSQLADVMADNYGYRWLQEQVIRDMALYGHSIAFVRCAWDRQCQLRHVDEEYGAELGYESYVVKEGVPFVVPHVSRVFWDISEPLAALNTDTGPTYCGYWDIVRYGTVRNNPDLWNRESITYSTGFLNLLSSYRSYFSQYYTTITPPDSVAIHAGLEKYGQKENVGYYASCTDDAAVMVASYFERIIPKEHGLGDYPYPVWVRLLVVSDGTVMHAEFLPSSPAAYCGLNEKSDMLVNMSLAMALLPYQDQMSNLMTLLMAVCRSEQAKIYSIDTDVIDKPEEVARLRDILAGETRFPDPLVITYSSAKAEMIGKGGDVPVKITQPQSNPQSIQIIFNAMVTIIETVERLTAMSANEVGQPIATSAGGVSATEVQMIGATTSAVYNYISDAVDEWRAALKRIIWESRLACGERQFLAPVLTRYPDSVINEAGLKPVRDPSGALMVVGDVRRLPFHEIYTTRDGAERSVNAQSAATLTQLLGVISNPNIAPDVPKGKLIEIVNAIFRLSGAGVDLNLEIDPASASMTQRDMQVAQALTSLSAIVEQHGQQLAAILQKLGLTKETKQPQLATGGEENANVGSTEHTESPVGLTLPSIGAEPAAAFPGIAGERAVPFAGPTA